MSQRHSRKIDPPKIAGNLTYVEGQNYGLYLPPMIWREMDNFSSGSVCLALASEPYDASDYYRDFDEYLKALPPGGVA